MNVLKYDKSKYIDSCIFGVSEEEEYFNEKLVSTKKIHKCCVCEKKIPIGDYAVRQTCILERSGWVSCYICTKCIERHIKEVEGL